MEPRFHVLDLSLLSLQLKLINPLLGLSSLCLSVKLLSLYSDCFLRLPLLSTLLQKLGLVSLSLNLPGVHEPRELVPVNALYLRKLLL